MSDELSPLMQAIEACASHSKLVREDNPGILGGPAEAFDVDPDEWAAVLELVWADTITEVANDRTSLKDAVLNAFATGCHLMQKLEALRSSTVPEAPPE